MPSSSPQSKPIYDRTLYVVLLAFTLISSVDVVHCRSSKSKPGVIDAPVLTDKIRSNRTIKVALDNSAEFNSVQAAIDSVPDGNSDWVTIHVRKGVYRY